MNTTPNQGPVAHTVFTPNSLDRAKELFHDIERATSGLATLGELVKVARWDRLDEASFHDGLGNLLIAISDGIYRYAEDGSSLDSPLRLKKEEGQRDG